MIKSQSLSGSVFLSCNFCKWFRGLVEKRMKGVVVEVFLLGSNLILKKKKKKSGRNALTSGSTRLW